MKALDKKVDIGVMGKDFKNRGAQVKYTNSNQPDQERARVKAGTELKGADYKTRLCYSHRLGNCRFKDKCTFAHGPSELIVPDPKKGGEKTQNVINGILGLKPNKESH